MYNFKVPPCRCSDNVKNCCMGSQSNCIYRVAMLQNTNSVAQIINNPLFISDYNTFKTNHVVNATNHSYEQSNANWFLQQNYQKLPKQYFTVDTSRDFLSKFANYINNALDIKDCINAILILSDKSKLDYQNTIAIDTLVNAVNRYFEKDDNPRRTALFDMSNELIQIYIDRYLVFSTSEEKEVFKFAINEAIGCLKKEF